MHRSGIWRGLAGEAKVGWNHQRASQAPAGARNRFSLIEIG
jgi:hypothetical protein